MHSSTDHRKDWIGFF